MTDQNDIRARAPHLKNHSLLTNWQAPWPSKELQVPMLGSLGFERHDFPH